MCIVLFFVGYNNSNMHCLTRSSILLRRLALPATLPHHQQGQPAHTDLPVPSLDAYRCQETMDSTKPNRDSHAERMGKHYLATTAFGALSVYSTKVTVQALVASMAPAADAVAMAQIEIKLDTIELGKHKVFKWRGKPLFVWHRSPAMIEDANSVDVSSLRDPEEDDARTKRPEWLVVIGVCTHLGCVPIPNAGEFGGYYCPCHGSHYDTSGRIRKGPAPLNLEVPMYEFEGDDTLVVGEEM